MCFLLYFNGFTTIGSSAARCSFNPVPTPPIFPIFLPCSPVCTLSAKLLQSCPILCDPMDRSPQRSSVQGILQARVLQWVAVPSSRGSSQPGIKPASLTAPALAGGFFTTSTTWEAPSPVYLPASQKWLLVCDEGKHYQDSCSFQSTNGEVSSLCPLPPGKQQLLFTRHTVDQA